MLHRFVAQQTKAGFRVARSTAAKQNASIFVTGWRPILANATRTLAGSCATVAESLAKNDKLPDMLCFQCEQTRDAKGCKTIGVCGKDADVAALQDLLVASCQAAAAKTWNAKDNKVIADTERILVSMFTTLTNVNFDAKRMIQEIDAMREILERRGSSFVKTLPKSGSSMEDFVKVSRKFGVQSGLNELGPDVGGLRELVIYGLKGVAAYYHHAVELGSHDPAILNEFSRLLSIVQNRSAGSIELGTLLEAALKTGELNLKVLESLEGMHKKRFGIPSPHDASTGHKAGKCILVSGHDLGDLESLLKAVEKTDINVYTHGEMLPAHGYPHLREHKNLAGHFGTAWMNQKIEFALFPGPVVLTSNCLMPPMKKYKDRLFTMQAVGYDGVKHISKNDWNQVIEIAKKEPGFKDTITGKSLKVGTGADWVLSNAGAVVDAIKSGAVKSFFVIGGCDGAEKERSYFHDVAVRTPNDSIILTLGCGKFRFNKELNDTKVGPFPKVLDMGQCNDSYGAIRVALALTNALGAKHPNDLPIHYSVSWFEQKAVAVLLTMLHLGIQKIHLGPALPAFVSPAVLNVLVDKFKLAPIGDPAADYPSVSMKLA